MERDVQVEQRLVHERGWALRLLVFAVAGGSGIAEPKGPLHALWARLDPGNTAARTALGGESRRDVARA